MARKNAKQAFGKDARVIVTDPESPYHFMVGTIATGNLQKGDTYAVAFDEPTGRQDVHVNHLELASEEEESTSVPEIETAQSYTSEEMAAFNSELLKEDGKQYLIMEGTLKDDYCNFSFKIIDGVGAGNVCIVKDTKHIVLNDLKRAFERFHVHLAVIDDVFRHSGIEILDIDTLHNHEHTMLYHVTGFKIAGNEEGETIVLKGSKYTSSGDRIELTSPKIALDNLSSYKWYNELKAAADEARREVALYKEGKYTVEEEDEEDEDLEGLESKPKRKKKANAKQLTIGDAIAEAQAAEDSDDEDADDTEDLGGGKLFIPGGFQTMDASALDSEGIDSDFEAAKI